MASQLLIYVQICASLLLRGSLDRRVAGAFSLSPVPWASGHNTDHIRSHFYPNHCIVSNIRVKNILLVSFLVFKNFVGNVSSCEDKEYLFRIQRQFQTCVQRLAGGG